jgi:Rod binding domain-containing protein
MSTVAPIALTGPPVATVALPGTPSTVASTPVGAANAATSAAKPPLTAEQKAALKNLHATAQQFESLFVNMLFKSMRAASPQTSITGEKLSPAETTFSEMLDEKRAESIAQTGAFGIGKVLEDQLKASVLANPAKAAKARLAPAGIL